MNCPIYVLYEPTEDTKSTPDAALTHRIGDTPLPPDILSVASHVDSISNTRTATKRLRDSNCSISFSFFILAFVVVVVDKLPWFPVSDL